MGDSLTESHEVAVKSDVDSLSCAGVQLTPGCDYRNPKVTIVVPSRPPPLSVADFRIAASCFDADGAHINPGESALRAAQYGNIILKGMSLGSCQLQMVDRRPFHDMNLYDVYAGVTTQIITHKLVLSGLFVVGSRVFQHNYPKLAHTVARKRLMRAVVKGEESPDAQAFKKLVCGIGIKKVDKAALED